ncbi:PDDEXK-like family protein [Actinoplanes awajinensis]|uniref:PD-(D/E)XK nuclease superfamily protein n=1 Tax=Actinoplanes awajinensis subsp. mycoplanecinus TaxID=135947 RepID=A0A0X3V9G6_9ACTN|nr:hypothetical protein [Actinoplanes awajinensis]KUL41214.1 hypothetical protein ADL15_05290 [Actinoplanes awajinensis subsp. mycoplanecinus]
MTALARLLASENNTSDLLAYLIELDATPLVAVLGLPPGTYAAAREVRTGGRRSRLDLVVHREGSREPVAVLEVKGAAGEHGDQLARYAEWAPSAKLFYCTLDGTATAAPAPWQPLSLVALFGAWHGSSHVYAAWLADEIAGVLGPWNQEADGVIGASTGPYVANLVTRRTAAAVGGVAGSTTPGMPMLVVFRAHPGGGADARIGVDVRCNNLTNPAESWLFRPFVQVGTWADPTPAAKLAVQPLAAALQDALTWPAIRQVVKDPGVLNPGGNDGLRNPPGGTQPIFYDDRGVRLATQFKVDVTRVTRFDLAAMITAVLDHLEAATTVGVPAVTTGE